MTGTIIEKQDRGGDVIRALRFTAYGKRRYMTLGQVTAAEAERELQTILTDVEQGTWRASQQLSSVLSSEGVPSFRAFAQEWWQITAHQLAAATQRGYSWRLERHLLPYFGDLCLSEINAQAVEGYIAAKLSEAEPLSATSINMTIVLLGAILESAVERRLIADNPVRGSRLRVPAVRAQRHYLQTAAQIESLLDSASELDHEAAPGARHIERRAMLATLTFAGLRIGELCTLRWRELDLAGGMMTLADSKLDAGTRRVRIRPALSDELRAVRARSPQASPGALVFPSRGSRPQDAHNFRARVFVPVVARANANRTDRGLEPLPERITPHSLRRTFATILYALGEDLGAVMDELGHTDSGVALSVRKQTTQLASGEHMWLQALVEGSHSRPYFAAGAVTSEITQSPISQNKSN
ncbi:MAG: tyrosine-type recombinase/integrase [Solirubrobacteraceae bacterium]